MIRLGVNVDHVATVRQARKTVEPDPVAAAAIAEIAGAEGITVHLREDRRHMQDRDIEVLRKTVRTHLNLEMAVSEEIVKIAENIKPDYACLVPEKREEVTTEGGLDVVGGFDRIKEVTSRLNDKGIKVSLFIDPVAEQIEASASAGAQYIELHTGTYAEVWGDEDAVAEELQKLSGGAVLAVGKGLRVNGGHGLTYQNVKPVAAIPQLEELNIGHSIIARAVLTGLDSAVRDMRGLMLEARNESLQK
ncbi:MAG: pyridoxine 5'-phosphate synthase [Planctomycetota bacterium]|jgi:pyridoxine 5-phosphate synthase